MTSLVLVIRLATSKCSLVQQAIASYFLFYLINKLALAST